ncbi:MAG: hypothetical protein ACK58M_11190 [Acidobacteriota bacterium]|jgi:hypothetical protein|nr:hypothetical protein [Bryobacteraceae bacterium CoA2 C42]
MPPNSKSRRRLPTIRIGHLSITLLPGETVERVQQITDQVWDRWQPDNIVEQFDCDMIIHALFKIERYERFRDQFVASGIRAEDLDRAQKSYESTIVTAERSLLIARESNSRPRQQVTPDLLADWPVDGPVQ